MAKRIGDVDCGELEPISAPITIAGEGVPNGCYGFQGRPGGKSKQFKFNSDENNDGKININANANFNDLIALLSNDSHPVPTGNTNVERQFSIKQKVLKRILI